MQRLFALFVTFGLIAGVAYAHNGMEHVMGSVVAITATNITVRASDGASQTVALTEDTKCMKGTTPFSFKDIKVGDRVVIHATRKANQLTAAEIKVAAMTGKSGEMHGMKMDSGSQKAPQ